jgi:hypothetical protein
MNEFVNILLKGGYIHDIAGKINIIIFITLRISIPWIIGGTILAILDSLKLLRTKEYTKKKLFKKWIKVSLGGWILGIITFILWGLLLFMEIVFGVCLISCESSMPLVYP